MVPFSKTLSDLWIEPLDWPLNASRGFVSIGWASCLQYYCNSPIFATEYSSTAQLRSDKLLSAVSRLSSKSWRLSNWSSVATKRLRWPTSDSAAFARGRLSTASASSAMRRSFNSAMCRRLASASTTYWKTYNKSLEDIQHHALQIVVGNIPYIRRWVLHNAHCWTSPSLVGWPPSWTVQNAFRQAACESRVFDFRSEL